MSMGAFKTAMDVYISYKFVGLLSDTFVVNAAQICTVCISQHSGLFIYVDQGAAHLYFATICQGATLLCQAGYTLGFATHF